MGLLLRDSSHCMMVTQSLFLPVSYTLEFCAILEGISLVRSLRYSHIIVESNSFEAIKLLSGRLNSFGDGWKCLGSYDIKILSLFFDSIQFIHASRRHNRPAKLDLCFHSTNSWVSSFPLTLCRLRLFYPCGFEFLIKLISFF